VQAAIRHAEFTLTRQTHNGWFESCCLTDVERPLLHTVAYTMQGLVGMGKLVGRHDFIAAGAKRADALLKLMASDDFIPGENQSLDDRRRGLVLPDRKRSDFNRLVRTLLADQTECLPRRGLASESLTDGSA
jgi:hypothetical protein